MKLKLLNLLLGMMSFASPSISEALPVLNLNAAPIANNIVVYPDSRDENLFYLLPNKVTTSMNNVGDPDFQYSEFRSSWTNKALVQTVLQPAVHLAELEAVKDSILKFKPLAKFTSMPYQSSRIELSGELSALIESHDCSHQAGNAFDEVSCTLILSSKGMKVLTPSFRAERGVIVNFLYEMSGVQILADGSYQDKLLTFSVTGHIGGQSTTRDPAKYVDSRGNPIYFGD